MSTDYYQQGLDFAEREDWDSAISCFREVIRLDPHYAPGYFQLGAVYQSDGCVYPAVMCYSDAIHLDREFAEAYRSRGIALSEMEVYDIAIKDLSDVIRLLPNDSLGYYQRAEVYSKNGSVEKALRDLTEVVRLEPTNHAAIGRRGDLLGRRGDLLLAQGEFREAMEEYFKAASLKSEDAADAFTRGDANRKQKQYLWAIAYFTVAIDQINQKSLQSGTAQDDSERLFSALDHRGHASRLHGSRLEEQKSGSGTRAYQMALDDYSEMICVQPSSEVGYLRRVELYEYRSGYGPNLTVAGKTYGKAEWREDKKMVKELRK